jgi:hypothetical protein
MGWDLPNAETEQVEPHIECHSDLRVFFHDKLTRAFAARHITAPPFTEAYLVALLAALGPSVVPQTSLTELRIEAESAPLPERLDKLRAVGDLALSRTGLFAAKLGRIGVSKDYVSDLGTQAYRAASQLASVSPRNTDRTRAAVFFDLGDRFGTYTDVLEDVREATHLGEPDDLLALYERYARTGSSAVLAKLGARGVVCIADPKTVAEG